MSEKNFREELLADALDHLTGSLEERIVRHFNQTGLTDDEITDLVQWALSEFPPGVLDDFVGEAFDIIYEVIEKAIERTRL